MKNVKKIPEHRKWRICKINGIPVDPETNFFLLNEKEDNRDKKKKEDINIIKPQKQP